MPAIMMVLTHDPDAGYNDGCQVAVDLYVRSLQKNIRSEIGKWIQLNLKIRSKRLEYKIRSIEKGTIIRSHLQNLRTAFSSVFIDINFEII